MLRETTIKNGKLRGHAGNNARITVFKGIPFAAPPVGPLRWQAPQAAADWTSVREADRFGPIAMQVTPGSGDPEQLYNKEWHVDMNLPMAEDCLYLNVWTPNLDPEAKLPVMVWIFGGGFQVGYPSEMEFNGEAIAKRGVVFVSINYRLNVFGFMAHPELTREQPEAPTNFALLDQQFALAWVRENIEAFGGDPDNVTLYGQSAGAAAVMAQICNRDSRTNFHKAILQSGGGILAMPRPRLPELSDKEAIGEAFLDYLGVKTIEEARQIEAGELWQKAHDFQQTQDQPMIWQPSVDGAFIQQQHLDSVLQGVTGDLPVMSGFTVDEFPQFPLISELGKISVFPRTAEYNAEEVERYAAEVFGDRAEEFLNLIGYPEADPKEIMERGTTNAFEHGLWLWIQLRQINFTHPAYLYAFGPPMPGDDAGAFHSAELWFMFETLAGSWRPFTGEYYDLARQMCNYWTNFAKYSNPNGDDVTGKAMPYWQSYHPDEPEKVMRLDLAPAMTKDYPSAVMDLLIDTQLAQLAGE